MTTTTVQASLTLEVVRATLTLSDGEVVDLQLEAVVKVAEAKELLLLHSFGHSDLDHPKMNAGFLGQLRPYAGKLNIQNLHEVMNAIRVLAPNLEKSRIDREVVASIWSICHLSLTWGVHPDGMLRRNGLVTEQDVSTLTKWVSCISYATMILLNGGGIDEAFAEYRQLDSK